METLIFVLLLTIVVLLLFDIHFWRENLSKTAELTAAVDAAVAKIGEQKDSTPDVEIQPLIDKLNAAVNPPAPAA